MMSKNESNKSLILRRVILLKPFQQVLPSGLYTTGFRDVSFLKETPDTMCCNLPIFYA